MKTNELAPALRVSEMSGKMAGIPALSTSTRTNANCERNRKIPGSICARCYATRQTTYRINLENVLLRNSAILSGGPLAENQIPRTNARWFRFESHGDLINRQHLANLCAIVVANPQTEFALWTKRYPLAEAYFAKADKPSNLTLIYSSLMVGTPLDIRGFRFPDKIFTVYEKGTPGMNCQQACMTCLKCYRKSDRTKYIREHYHA